MAGQVAHHLMAQAGMTRAPWAITTVVSCLPVLVPGMGTAPAHILRPMLRPWLRRTAGPGQQPPYGPYPGLPRTRTDQAAGSRRLTGTDLRGGTRKVPSQDHDAAVGSADLARGPPDHRWIRPARPPGGWPQRGSPVSRRALRSGGGVSGSNEALNALARMLSAELAGCAGSG
jgi:hypothetical protein